MTEGTPIPLDDAAMTDADLTDADLTTTATALQRALVRFHPSFAFEERLAARLRTLASGQASIAETPGRLIAFPGSAPAAGVAAPMARRTRGLLLGGAIASGVIASGVSLAGAALLAWRRARIEHRWERFG